LEVRGQLYANNTNKFGIFLGPLGCPEESLLCRCPQDDVNSWQVRPLLPWLQSRASVCARELFGSDAP